MGGRGWLTHHVLVGRYGDVPIRVHPSVLLVPLLLSRLSFAPGAWLGYVTVLATHLLGHALFIRRVGLPIVSVEVHGAGGTVRYGGLAEGAARAAIAWGGVGLQAVAMLLVVAVDRLWPQVPSAFGADWRQAMLAWNGAIMVVNLLPLPAFDGAQAWGLVPRLLRRLRPARPAPALPGPRAAPRRAIHLVDASDEVAGDDPIGGSDPIVRALIERARRQPRDPRRVN